MNGKPTQGSYRAGRLLVAAVCIVIGAVAVLVLRPASADRSSSFAPEVGHRAPLFSLPTLAGQPGHLRDYLGHPLLLQFWAVNCPSCTRERPALTLASRSFRAKGGVVLGVDAFLEPPSLVGPYVRRNAEPYSTILLDPDGRVVLGAYHIRDVPTSVFIRRDGTINSISIGPLDAVHFEAEFHALGA
jgi:thiol-disulfide isomerase/thioredoxin